MLLRRNPNMAITPPAELSQLLHLFVRMLDVILDREPVRIIHTDVTAEPKEDARCFEGDKPRVRSAASRVGTVSS